MILLHIQQEHSFLTYLSKHRQAEIGHFRGVQISSSENFSKRDAILAPVTKQWMARDIPSYGGQSKHAKIAI